MLRKKIVWFIYVAYLMTIGIAAFGMHDMRTNRDLAGIALKSPIIQKTEPEKAVFDFTGDGMPNHVIAGYQPNIGGFIVWAGAGVIVAYLLQGKSGNKNDQSA